jgi:homoserine kinase type II
MSKSALEIVGLYGITAQAVEPLGNHGGFSGARIWRVRTPDRVLCLRAWPPDRPTPERLTWLHGLMAAARLPFVPGVVAVPGTPPGGLVRHLLNVARVPFVPNPAADRGPTWVRHAGRLWEVTTWMPGSADFHLRPSSARIAAACTALARLHDAWSGILTEEGPCAALGERSRAAEEWLSLVGSGWQPPALAASDPVTPWAERAWQVVRARVGLVRAELAPWAGRRLPLHPCLCDVKEDHVLFEGDAVTGLIDYGNVKVDHAAVDLARLLGGLAGDDTAGWAVGLDAYTSLRPLNRPERDLARALDRTGVVLSVTFWLRWLFHDGRHYEDREAVARRLAGLVRRLEAWG